MVVAVVMFVVVVDGTHTPVTFYVPMGREEESVAESQSAAPGVALIGLAAPRDVVRRAKGCHSDEFAHHGRPPNQ